MTIMELEDVVKNIDRRLTHVEQILPTLATKEDLKAFATKEDLKAFATKEDLKAFATKEDLKAFATKADLDTFAAKAEATFATKVELKETRDEMRTGFARLERMILEGDEETRRYMRVLYEDLVARIATLQEGRRQ